MDIRAKAQNSMIKFIDHMKFKKKEDQSVDTSVLLRSGNKIIMGGRGEEGHEREREEDGERGAGSGVGGDGGKYRMEVCSSGGWGAGGSH